MRVGECVCVSSHLYITILASTIQFNYTETIKYSVGEERSRRRRLPAYTR